MKFVRLTRGDGGVIYFGQGYVIESPYPNEPHTRVTYMGVPRMVQGTPEEVVREFETNLE